MRKIHSLTGIVPLGGFFIFHLWTNAKALQGQLTFDDAVAEIHHLPYLLIIEIAGIFLPLLFHALYGIKLSFESRVNLRQYPYSRNWMYTLQRVTGILTFAFICYHLWQFRVQVALGNLEREDFFTELCASLSSTTAGGIPLVALAYLLGIASTAFHFANGLYGFCFSWGITLSRRATRVASTVFGLIGLALFVLGANTVIYFATGSRLVFSPHSQTTPAAGCYDQPPSNTEPSLQSSSMNPGSPKPDPSNRSSKLAANRDLDLRP